MNWLDIVILVVLVVLALIGWRMGLVRAVVMAAGAFISSILAAQISEPVAEKLSGSIQSDAVATVLAYIIVGAAAFVIIMVAGSIITTIVKLVLLGWANTLLGALIGATAGFLAGAALVLVLTRLAFLVPAHPLETIGPIETRTAIVKALKGSGLVPVYLKLYDALPANALGLIPGDFKVGVDELRKAIDTGETS